MVEQKDKPEDQTEETDSPVKIIETNLTDLTPDAANANRGTQRGEAMIEASLRQYGAGRSILVDKTGRIIAGNKTLEQAVAIGLEDVIIVQTDGKKLVAVQRTDLDLSEGGDARELAYIDNRSSEVSIEWDPAQILIDSEMGVDFGGIFYPEEIQKMLPILPPQDAPPQIDRAAELQEKWGTEVGQIWAMGEHRLVVGDCTDKGVVETVLQGEIPLLMVTDPPYGVNYDPEWRAQNDEHFGHLRGNSLKSYGQVSNDDTCDWTNAYQLFKGDVVYVWHADQHAIRVAMNLEIAEFVIRSQIIWRKPNFVISRGNYHYQHEPCWYAVRKGKTSNWQGDRTQSTVWDIASLQPMGRSQDPLDETTGHGTQKPTECMARPIRNNTKIGELIYDPFLGSGTTMVACENLGRRCRGVEIDPGYVAVCLQRFQDSFNITPQLITP